ncbi:hypothetical protein BGZ76_006424, partial [Entomortierella beljakovae]
RVIETGPVASAPPTAATSAPPKNDLLSKRRREPSSSVSPSRSNSLTRSRRCRRRREIESESESEESSSDGSDDDINDPDHVPSEEERENETEETIDPDQDSSETERGDDELEVSETEYTHQNSGDSNRSRGRKVANSNPRKKAEEDQVTHKFNREMFYLNAVFATSDFEKGWTVNDDDDMKAQTQKREIIARIKNTENKNNLLQPNTRKQYLVALEKYMYPFKIWYAMLGYSSNWVSNSGTTCAVTTHRTKDSNRKKRMMHLF